MCVCVCIASFQVALCTLYEKKNIYTDLVQLKEGEEAAGAGEQLQLEVADLTTKEKIELKNLHF